MREAMREGSAVREGHEGTQAHARAMQQAERHLSLGLRAVKAWEVLETARGRLGERDARAPVEWVVARVGVEALEGVRGEEDDALAPTHLRQKGAARMREPSRAGVSAGGSVPGRVRAVSQRQSLCEGRAVRRPVAVGLGPRPGGGAMR